MWTLIFASHSATRHLASCLPRGLFGILRKPLQAFGRSDHPTTAENDLGYYDRVSLLLPNYKFARTPAAKSVASCTGSVVEFAKRSCMTARSASESGT